MPNLTEKRAKDRAIMAASLAELIRGAGATVETEWERGREIMLRIVVSCGERAASIGVNFDGDSSQPDVHVATWNTEGRVCFSDAMGASSLNTFHYGKATRICEGFMDLSNTLKRDVKTLLSGEGFSPEREDEMRKRYAERGWTW